MVAVHRVTTFQLLALLLASCILGACAMFVAERSVSSRAEAAVVKQGAQRSSELPAKSRDATKSGRPVTHFEIGCRDSAKTRDFYAKLFDWQIVAEGQAAMIHTGGKGIDGHITALGHDPQNYVTVYVEVEDAKAYLDKAKALGGKILVPPIKIPTGRFAWLSDPDGNIVGLLEPKRP